MRDEESRLGILAGAALHKMSVQTNGFLPAHQPWNVIRNGDTPLNPQQETWICCTYLLKIRSGTNVGMKPSSPR